MFKECLDKVEKDNASNLPKEKKEDNKEENKSENKKEAAGLGELEGMFEQFDKIAKE